MEVSGGGFPLKPEHAAKFYPVHAGGTGISVNGEERTAFTLGRGGFAIHKTESVENLDAERAKLRKAAEGFEAIFVRQFLRTMNSTISGGMFGGGIAGEMYGDIAENALAETMAGEGRFGIADSLYRQLSSRLEANASGRVVPLGENTPKAGEGK